MCSSWGVDDERKGDRSVFGTMANGSQGFVSTDDPGADAPGAGAVVRHLVAGLGLEGSGHGSGAGAGPAHHRTLGGGLWCGRAQSPDIRADRWFPPALGEAQRATLKEAVQELPEAAGSGFANWNWKGVHQFVREQFGLSLCRSSCLTYLRRLGFAFKRPKKRLLKADAEKREAFVAAYAARWEEAQRRPNGLKPGYSSLMRPTSVPMWNCGASGCCGESQPW